jgi:hypothetical protein
LGIVSFGCPAHRRSVDELGACSNDSNNLHR